MMTIKQINSQQLGQYFDLQSYAFPTDPAGNREERTDKIWEHMLALGAYSTEEELESALIIRKNKVHFHGQSLGMGGIGNVASYPEARGKGNIRQLFKEALTIMRAENMLVSYLAPFSYHFYRKFGYELTFERRAYQIRDFTLTYKPDDSGTIKRVKWKDEREALKAIYAKKYHQASGPVEREDWVWEENMLRNEKQTVALYRNEAGEPEGYVLYHFNLFDNTDFKIDELVALNGEAEKTIWAFLATHGSHFETFTYQAGSNKNLSYLFKEPREEQKWVSGMMARIVDFEAFLKIYPFKKEKKQILTLEVTEDFAEWNTGQYRMTLSPDGTQVEKVDAEAQTNVLSADIQTWTQLFMGTRTTQDLCYQGNIRGKLELVEALGKAMENKNPELYDYF